MSEIKVRINGRGNAWPVILGQDHPFYDRSNSEDLANVSCSMINTKVKEPKENDIEWELMIDAGHGVVQYLLKNCNRIPEAIFLTHAHIDHTLGLDWIVQSYYKTFNKPYPVYATILCWQIVIDTFPHLEGMIELKELIPFQKTIVNEVIGVEVTPYPVYHGKSAAGATMLLFTVRNKLNKGKILFTGDILCPLLRDQDYKELMHTDLIIADANNRFPYPKSNHWSIIENNNKQPYLHLNNFLQECSIGLFLNPHINTKSTDNYSRCFDYFFNKMISINDLCYSIENFVKKINPRKVALVHYSGSEDLKYLKEPILNDSSLESWVNIIFSKNNSKTKFFVPYVSQHIDFL